MAMLERRELGHAGLTYIRERLARGRTLSHLLLAGLDLAGGHSWTYLPPAMTQGQATRFAEGGLAPLATGTAPVVFENTGGRWQVVENPVEPLVTAQVGDFLTQHPHGVAVWEDPVADAGDPWVRDHPEEPLLFLGDEVYYVLSHATAGLSAIEAGLSAEVMSAWWGSPAVLAALPDEALRPFVTRRALLATEQLQSLVDHCRLLLFLAYDGEGYVLWSPEGVGGGGEEGESADASETSAEDAS
jgi:hypothetical protein